MALDPNTYPYAWPPPEWSQPVDPYVPQMLDTALAPPAEAPVLSPSPMTPPPQEVGFGAPPVADEVAQNPNGISFAPPPEPLPTPSLIEMPDDFVGKPTMPEPLPLEVDAVSGGKVPGQEILGAHQTSGTPQLPEDYLGTGELGAKWANEDPEKAILRRADADEARENFLMAGQIEASRESRRQAEANFKIEQQARERTRQALAEVDADAKKLADTPIDQDGWMNSRSELQKFLAFTSAIVGGLASARSGGPNVGLDMIRQQMDQHIEIQKANLAAKRADIGRREASIGRTYELDMEDAKALETQRQAMYEFAVRDLQSQYQQFDPRGTRARKIEDAVRGLRGQQAQAQAAFEQKDFENRMKLGEFALKQDTNLLARQTAEAKMRADAAKAAAGKKVKPSDVVHPPEYFEAMYGKKPKLAMSQNQYEEWAKTGKVVEEYSKAQREASPEERARQFATGQIVDDQGDPVLFRSPESAAKVGKFMGATDMSVQLIDKLISARRKHGWSSNLFKSPEWREMQADYAQFILEKKTIDELGVIAGPDMELMQKAAGTTDPTELRDPTPGLRRLRQNMVQKANTTITNEVSLPKGRAVKPYAPPPPPPPTPETPADAAFKDALAFDPKQTDWARLSAELGVKTLDDAGLRAALEANQGMVPSVRETIDGLASAISSKDPKVTDDLRKAAVEQLDELAKNAQSPKVREYALRASSGAGHATIPLSGEDL